MDKQGSRWSRGDNARVVHNLNLGLLHLDVAHALLRLLPLALERPGAHATDEGTLTSLLISPPAVLDEDRRLAEERRERGKDLEPDRLFPLRETGRERREERAVEGGEQLGALTTRKEGRPGQSGSRWQALAGQAGRRTVETVAPMTLAALRRVFQLESSSSSYLTQERAVSTKTRAGPETRDADDALLLDLVVVLIIVIGLLLFGLVLHLVVIIVARVVLQTESTSRSVNRSLPERSEGRHAPGRTKRGWSRPGGSG